MKRRPQSESEEEQKVIKVLSDELCYFRSFARMEETKMCHIEKELEEVREVEDEMRTLKSDLANAKMELNFYRKKKLLEEEQSKFMHEPLANRIMNSTGKTNILFLGIDGLRPDALLLLSNPDFLTSPEPSPLRYCRPVEFNNNKFFENQCCATRSRSTGTAYTFHMHCDIPVSGPSWATLLTGQSHRVHGVGDNNFKSMNVRTLFANVKTSKMFASSWDGMRRMCSADVGSYIFHAEADTKTNDERVVSDTLTFVNTVKEAPEITFVYLNHVDRTGHLKGFGPHVPEYMDAVRVSKNQIESLLKCVDQRRKKRNEKWIVILTTDHGGSDRACMSKPMQHDFDHCTCGEQEQYSGVHGMETLLSHRQTFFFVCGDGVRSGEIIPPPLNTDIKNFTHDIIGV